MGELLVYEFANFRGELGILKKKHIGIHKDLEDQKTGIHSMQAEQNRLEIVIKGMEKVPLDSAYIVTHYFQLN